MYTLRSSPSLRVQFHDADFLSHFRSRLLSGVPLSSTLKSCPCLFHSVLDRHPLPFPNHLSKLCWPPSKILLSRTFPTSPSLELEVYLAYFTWFLLLFSSISCADLIEVWHIYPPESKCSQSNQSQGNIHGNTKICLFPPCPSTYTGVIYV